MNPKVDFIRLTVFLIVVVLLSRVGTTQTEPAVEQLTPKRVALIIGNSNYEKGALPNAANDADALSQALSALDFKVTLQHDRTQQQIKADVDEITNGLEKGDLCLFFYAGHGHQYQNENFLVPIDANITRPQHVGDQCVSLNYILEAMEKSGSSLHVVVLDCCRDNPFPSFSRGGGRGLAPVQPAPDGEIIAFSTPSGQTALDGDGANSPFTKNLINVLADPSGSGLEIVDLFRTTALFVKKEVGQVPYLNFSAALPKYYLRQPESSATTSETALVAALRTKLADDRAYFIRSSREGNSIEGYEATRSKDVAELLGILKKLDDTDTKFLSLLFLNEHFGPDFGNFWIAPSNLENESSLYIDYLQTIAASPAFLKNSDVDQIFQSAAFSNVPVNDDSFLKEIELCELAMMRSIHENVRAAACESLYFKLEPLNDFREFYWSEYSEEDKRDSTYERRNVIDKIDVSNERILGLLVLLSERYGDEKVRTTWVEDRSMKAFADDVLDRRRRISKGVVVPEIECDDIYGQPIRLSDFKGKRVFLVFTPDFYYPEPKLIDWAKQHVPADSIFVGIVDDSFHSNEAKEKIPANSNIHFMVDGKQREIAKNWRVDESGLFVEIDDEGKLKFKSIFNTVFYGGDKLLAKRYPPFEEDKNRP